MTLEQAEDIHLTIQETLQDKLMADLEASMTTEPNDIRLRVDCDVHPFFYVCRIGTTAEMLKLTVWLHIQMATDSPLEKIMIEPKSCVHLF
ncbi:unnamed protein product [Pieris macdunnoughi]|uniref:Uncharacterized protein n=1 Tax=Pieris macdunnoughi TaxID=345717 RepID=A0A821VVU3_9NEOP|nr:unnamed protein product [Pieris macdunnoughi]